MKRLSTTRILCRLALIGSLFAVQAVYAEPERFALVIGNADYSGSFSPLKNPSRDAEAIAAALEKLGFRDHVALYKNVDRAGLRQARIDFEQQLHQHPHSIALVYFNGHGLQGSDGKNYLIPTNANIKYHEDVDEEGIAIAKMLEDINANQPQMTIFIVDACRNAVKLESRQTKGSAIKGTMNAMKGAAGSLIAFAASPDQYALDYVNDSDTHSPYTTALLESIAKPGFDIETVFKETRKKVLQLTQGQQIPTETSILVGNFYFSPVSAENSLSPTAANTQTAAPDNSGLSDLSKDKEAPNNDSAESRLKAMEAEMLAIYKTQNKDDPYFQAQCAKEVGFWQEQAERNQPIAQTLLAGCYEFGVGIPQSDTEAVAWFRKAAEQGVAVGQYNLGWMYQEGRGVPQSDTEAVAWYRKAAAQGDVSGQTYLGWMYSKGKGVPQSDTEAVAWFRKAAAQGDASGQSSLGSMYQEGKGVPQSDTEAVAWYRKAADQGYVVPDRKSKKLKIRLKTLLNSKRK